MEEPFPNISGDWSAERRIKPNEFALPISFLWFLLVLLNFSLKSVYPLSLRAFSYGYLDELKTSSLEEFLDKRSLIIFGNWSIICGGWFEDLLTYNNKSFGFLYGLRVPLFKLNVVFKKSTILRLVYTSMAEPTSLNVLIIFSRIRSICWPFTFRNMSGQSSPYKPKSSLLISFAKEHKIKIPTSSHTSALSKLLIVTSNQLSVCFFFHVSC